MPANDSTEFDYTPGFTKPTHEYGQPFGDEFHAEAVQELLLSTAGYTQRGVTLAGGQGVLPTGCVLARQTSTGLYFAYVSGGSGGEQIPVGILRDARDTGGTSSPSGKVSTPCLGNIVYRGVLNAALVSGTDTSSLVSGAQGLAQSTLTSMGARIVQFGGGVGSVIPFPGSPMDGVPVSGSPSGVSAFIF